MDFQLQPPGRAKGYALTHATTDHTTTPAQDRSKADKEAIPEEVLTFRQNFQSERSPSNPLDQLVRDGALQMLQAAIDAEVADFLIAHSHKVDAQGRR